LPALFVLRASVADERLAGEGARATSLGGSHSFSDH
jgi:hypothetical protein